MKKILILALIIGTVSILAPAAAEAKTTSSVSADPQIRVRIGPQRNRRINRRVRTTTFTRIVGSGRNRFRETVRVTYLPNGRTLTQVINRVRIGRNY
ncbi:MAG: hypothetical protein ABIO36_08205 [Pyrinomonadaceae bacterium]